MGAEGAGHARPLAYRWVAEYGQPLASQTHDRPLKSRCDSAIQSRLPSGRVDFEDALRNPCNLAIRVHISIGI